MQRFGCFGLISLLVALAGTVFQSKDVTQPQSEVKDSPPALPTTAIELVFLDGTRGTTLALTFRPDETTRADVESARGVWMRGTGVGYDSRGEVLARAMKVDFWVRLGAITGEIADLPGGQVVSFGRDQGIDLVRLERGEADGTRSATLVSFSNQRLGSARFDRAWLEVLPAREFSSLLAEIFRLLSGVSGQRDVIPCHPSFTECWNTAAEACRGKGVCEFSYSCNQSTGEASCAFKCCEVGGG